ncbi:hypothetical protein [Aeoliella sp. SH292]|uniref:hypothetical protein n=1 Tax=Aeoliella sp. SH292 TaxID=3454464 RepID=UPI003F9E40E1
MYRLIGYLLAVISCLAYAPMFVLVFAIGHAEIHRVSGNYCCGPSFYPSDLAVFTVPLALLASPFYANAAKRFWFISAVLILYPVLLRLVFDGLLKDYVLRGPVPRWATFLGPFELLTLIAIVMVTTLLAQAVRAHPPGEAEPAESETGQ